MSFKPDQESTLVPGPPKKYSFGENKTLEESGLSVFETHQLYSDYFQSKGHKLDYKIGKESTPTQIFMTTNIETEVPEEINQGHPFKLDMVVDFIINQKFIISKCEMMMDRAYFSDNKGSLFNFIDSLNEDAHEIGVNHFAVTTDDGLDILGWEQIWLNLLSEEMFEMYYFHITNNLDQFSHNFDHLHKFLSKLDLGDEKSLFPQFL